MTEIVSRLSLYKLNRRVCVGEIRLFGGNFAAQGWAALCNGQLLSTTQNTALFSLLWDDLWRRWPRTTDFNGAAIDFSTLEPVTTTPVTTPEPGTWGMLTIYAMLAAMGRGRFYHRPRDI